MTQVMLPLGFIGPWQWLIVGIFFFLIPYFIYRAAKGLIREYFKQKDNNK
jgi:hypothetical protein